MAESTLVTNHAVITASLARYMSFTSTVYGSLQAAEKLDIDECINRGYRQFLSPPLLPNQAAPHIWSFLRPVTTLVTTAPYDTGTVTIVLGVVTLAGGTFPTWAADGVLVVDGTGYTVNTRDSGSQVTLDDLTVTAAAGSAFSLTRPDMTLSDDFQAIDGPLTYQAITARPKITIVDERMIRELRQSQLVSAGQPYYASIQPGAAPTGTTVGQRWTISFYPTPDAAYRLVYRYIVQVNKIDTTTNTIPIGGLLHGETILASCLSIAEGIRERDGSGRESGNKPQMEHFLQRLAGSIAMDQRASGVDYIGYNGDPGSSIAEAARRINFNVTYMGALP